MPLLAIHFSAPDAPSGNSDHRIIRFPFVARVVQAESTTTASAPEAHGAIKVYAERAMTDPWSLPEASLVRALFEFARDHAESIARHQGRHMGGDHEMVLSRHEYAGPPPAMGEAPETTILQIELDNPIRLLAP